MSVGANHDLLPVPASFMWRDPATATEVLALFHPGGHGATDAEPEGVYVDPVTQEIRGYPFGGDCVEVLAAKAAVCYAWQQDN